MAKKESAEEKLKKMLEASEGAQSGAQSATLNVPRKRSKGAGLVGLVKFFNILLILGIVLTSLGVANEIRAGMELLNENIEITIDHQSSRTAAKAPELPTFRELPDYMAQIDKRNIFQPYQERTSVQIVESTPKDNRILERTDNLRLVGIAWMDRVETASVMLEDTEKNVTYFLNKGEKLGDIFVKTIYADSVELGYENEEIIIKYDTPQM